VIVKLQDELLARGKELDSREGAVIMREESLMAFACVLRDASAEHDTSHARADAIQRDYSTQLSVYSSQSEWRRALGRTLDECAALLGLEEIDLEVHEVILAEDLECSLHPSDGQDLSAELKKACACVDMIVVDCAPRLSGYHNMLCRWPVS
jgi:hypothetical protein